MHFIAVVPNFSFPLIYPIKSVSVAIFFVSLYNIIMEEKLQQDGLEEICKLLASTDDADLIKKFFGCLFTPSELQDMEKRWLLVKEIDKGRTQREIARMFSMSLCKITRGSKELKKEGSAFRIMLDKATLL